MGSAGEGLRGEVEGVGVERKGEMELREESECGQQEDRDRQGDPGVSGALRDCTRREDSSTTLTGSHDRSAEQLASLAIPVVKERQWHVVSSKGLADEVVPVLGQQDQQEEQQEGKQHEVEQHEGKQQEVDQPEVEGGESHALKVMHQGVAAVGGRDSVMQQQPPEHSLQGEQQEGHQARQQEGQQADVQSWSRHPQPHHPTARSPEATTPDWQQSSRGPVVDLACSPLGADGAEAPDTLSHCGGEMLEREMEEENAKRGRGWGRKCWNICEHSQ